MDPELCRLFGVPLEALPEIRPTVAFDRGRRQARHHRQHLRSAGRVVRPWLPPRRQAKITFGTGAFALALADGNIAADRTGGPSPHLPPGSSAMPRSPMPSKAAAPMPAPMTRRAASACSQERDIGSPHQPQSKRASSSSALSGLPRLSTRDAAGMWLRLGLDGAKSERWLRPILKGVRCSPGEVIDDFATPLDSARSPSMAVSATTAIFVSSWPARSAALSPCPAARTSPSSAPPARDDRRRRLQVNSLPPHQPKAPGTGEPPLPRRRASVSAVPMSGAELAIAMKKRRSRRLIPPRRREQPATADPRETGPLPSPCPLYRSQHWKTTSPNRRAEGRERPKLPVSSKASVPKPSARNISKAPAPSYCPHQVPLGPPRRRLISGHFSG